MLSRRRPVGMRLAFDKATAILQADGSRDADGVWSDGPSVRVSIRCHAEPIGVEENLENANQYRVEAERKFYIPAGQTSRPLRPGDGSQRPQDRIEWDGFVWRVSVVVDFGIYQEVRTIREAAA